MPNARGSYAVGVDVGGTNIRAGVITREGRKLAERSRTAALPQGGNGGGGGGE